MEDINKAVHAELKEYAQLYFDAIKTANTTEGACRLKPGKYTAAELTNRSYKGALGCYALPEDEFFNEAITITAGTFELTLPYDQIFVMLARWEQMAKPGKDKAVFEVGAVEEKNAKVIFNEKTALGEYKTKRMKLQRIGGNWWAAPKEIRKEGQTTGYYELNGVMFAPGKTFWGNVRDEANQAFAAKYGDTELSKIILSYLTNGAYKERTDYGYICEVAKRVGIEQPATATETAQISTETAMAENAAPANINEPTTAKEAERAINDWCFSIPKNTHGLNLNTGATCNAKTLRTITMRIELRDGCDTLRYLSPELKPVELYKWLQEHQADIMAELNTEITAHQEKTAKQTATTTETPQTTKYITLPPIAPQPPRKRPIRAVRGFRTTGRRTDKKNLIVGCAAPGFADGFSADAGKTVYIARFHAPPIRGDCKLSSSARAQAPYFTIIDHISCFKLP